MDISPLKVVSIVCETINRFIRRFFRIAIKILLSRNIESCVIISYENGKYLHDNDIQSSNGLLEVEYIMPYKTSEYNQAITIFDDNKPICIINLEFIHEGTCNISILNRYIEKICKMSFPLDNRRPKIIIIKNTGYVISKRIHIEYLYDNNLPIQYFETRVSRKVKAFCKHCSSRMFLDGVMFGGTFSLLYQKMFPMSSIIDVHNLIE